MAKVEPFENTEVVKEHRASTRHSNRHSDTKLAEENTEKASGPGQLVFRARHLFKDSLQRCGWYESELAFRTRKFVRERFFVGLTMIALFIALFLIEIFAIAQVPDNTALDLILTLVFAIFAFEFLALTLTDASYLFGFFFWMDLLGTASLAFDISYMAGSDVREPLQVNRGDSSSQQNVIVVRATRAAKLGARTGRISRVLKILRYLPFFLNTNQDQKVKMAKVISNQLTNVLSIRVAFLTICLVVVMPLFTMFTYPEEDDSMGAWTELLALNGQDLFNALSANSGVEEAKQLMLSELARLARFYSGVPYGPFKVVYGQSNGVVFTPRADVLDLSGVTWTFDGPGRKASSRIVTLNNIQASFDMTTPKQMEAVMNIGLMVFIIAVMLIFGLVMSSSISVIALQPLERMLSVVRERCAQIFKYTSDLEDSDSDSDSDSEEYDDMEHVSEFQCLEKVVTKLAGIANLSAASKEPEVKANMTENDIMMLGWMQAPQVTTKREKSLVSARPSNMKAKTPGQLYGASESSDEVPRKVGALSTLPTAIIEALSTPDFNAFDQSKEVRISVAAFLVTGASGTWATWARSNIAEPVLRAFLHQMESAYTANPFHNFAHAVDVQYTVCRYFEIIEASRFLPEHTMLSMVLAAIAHDAGHSGVNNQYLVETASELAVRYNDRSPLENLHCSKLFQICSNPDTNVFAQVDRELYKELRGGIIDAILHTDPTKHNDMIREIGMLYQMNTEAFDSLNPDQAVSNNSSISLICHLLLHSADVSNPMKPWELCRQYAHLCMDEFFAQGDLERAAGIPVQMLNDREKVNRPNTQIGFIEFAIVPMCKGMVQMFPQLSGLAESLSENIQNWNNTWLAETSPAPDAASKVATRVKRVSDSLNDLVVAAEGHRIQAGAF